MTPLSTRMVEAAARAICRERCPGAHPCDMESTYCKPDKCSRWHVWTDEAHAALTAALALADAEGNALMPMLDPCETNTPVDGYNAGYNAHRAATLAGRAWP